MTIATTSPILLDVVDVPEVGLVGEPLPLTLHLSRPGNQSTPVRIRAVYCEDQDVKLDVDLVQRDLELRPGEFYKVIVPIKVSRPMSVPLQRIFVQFHEQGVNHADAIPLPEKSVEFRASPGHEINVLGPELLCNYEEGVKVLFSFKHEGTTAFKDVEFRLEPAEAVAAGKTVRRGIFSRDESVSLEAVVQPGPVEVVIQAAAYGRRVTHRCKYKIERPSPTEQRAVNRFIEPRRISTHGIDVIQVGEDPRPVELVRAAYPLFGDEEYEILITPPPDEKVTELDMKEIPGRVFVQKFGCEKGVWKFKVEVTWPDQMRRSDRLLYSGKSERGAFTGSVYITLVPSASRHFILAVKLGVALTLQGFVALINRMLDPELELATVFSHFSFDRDYQFLFLLSIPVFWIGWRLFDVLHFQLRT